MIKQRVLVLDIETWPLLAAVFALRDQNIGLNQIRKDTSVMAWGAKWLGLAPVMYMDTRKQKDVRDDKEILKGIWKLLDEADIVITQNGQSFDGPRLNARFMIHKMGPPSPYKHLDTYRIAKRVAEFTSNKLEYLTNTLNTKYKKLTHSSYPGMSLWNACELGDVKAWEQMKKYNIHDVLSTEELYLNLQAWAPISMPSPYSPRKEQPQCSYCASYSMKSQGIRKSKTEDYRRYLCLHCGKGQQVAIL